MRAIRKSAESELIESQDVSKTVDSSISGVSGIDVQSLVWHKLKCRTCMTLSGRQYSLDVVAGGPSCRFIYTPRPPVLHSDSDSDAD